MEAIRLADEIKRASLPAVNANILRSNWRPEVCDFIDWWASLRAENRVPTFEAFLNNPPLSLLPSCYIVYMVGNNVILRFQGAELVDRWHRDFTGKELLDWFETEARARCFENFSHIVGHSCGFLTRATMATAKDRSVFSDAVQLPLADEDGRVTRVVGYSYRALERERREYVVRLCDTHDTFWFNIGAGIPDRPPNNLHGNHDYITH